MNTLWQDLRYGARMLARRPGFTAVAALTLSMGIAAVSTILSIVNGFLLRPLPYPDPSRLVTLHGSNLKSGIHSTGVSLPDFADWRGANSVFEQMAAYAEESFNLSTGGRPERIPGAAVSAGVFSLLGVAPTLGRGLLSNDDQPGGERLLVLGHDLWQRRFGADPAIVGRTIRLDGQKHTVVGVMPAEFKFYEFAELWIPISAHAGGNWTDRRARVYEVIARLKPRVTVEQARADMDRVAHSLAQAYPETNEGVGVQLTSLEEEREEFGSALPLLLGAVGFVLLIVCANVANMLLARGAARQREMAIRIALGADRWRVIRQVLTESVLLSLFGAILGVILALWAADLIVASIPVPIPFWLKFTIDWRVLALTSLITLFTGTAVGLMPALEACRTNVNEQLKEGSTPSGSVRGRRSRKLLVVSQITLALILMCGSGVLIRSFLRLQAADVGFNPAGVITMQVELPTAQYPHSPQVGAFQQHALERMARLPGVESAAIFTPASDVGRTVTVDGQSGEGLASAINVRAVSADYFRMMGIPLRRGRSFAEPDAAESPGVVIVSETAAHRFWRGEEAVGRPLELGSTNAPDRLLTVVGVVGDVREPGLYARGVGVSAGLDLYVPSSQHPDRAINLAVRTNAEPANIAAAARAALQEVDAELPVYNVQTMERRVFGGLWPLRALAALLGIFASTGLFLAAVGIYGVISYSISQRTREIGIRMALGAQSHDVLKLVVREGMMLTAMGMVIGLAGALALTRLLSSLLYGVSAADPATFAMITLLLTSVALLTCYIPARRAAKVDPMIALRYE